MENLFENDAILNSYYKEFITALSDNDNYFEKEIFSGSTKIIENGIAITSSVCNFFSVLSGKLNFDISYSSSGSGSPGYIVRIKNLITGDEQEFRYASNINLSKNTPYEIIVSGEDTRSGFNMYLTKIVLKGAVKTIPERYIISEQL